MFSEATRDGPMAALERFVVENDELLELEERIGRFNIFDALGVARAEIRHSNFLAWLLDPGESHGQGDLFLKAVLMDMLKKAGPELRPLSPVEIDGVTLGGVEIRREWRHIDLLIACDSPRFVVAIENKVDSGEHGDQLSRYEDAVREFAEPGCRPLFVFLTPEGEDASDADWVSYSYADLHRILARAASVNRGSLGHDVEVFLEHYLRLIGSRFMDDPKILELCRHIYKTHRQAIDLIVENVGGDNAIIERLREDLRSFSPGWTILRERKNQLDILPTGWMEWVPDLCAVPNRHPKYWLRFSIKMSRRKCELFFEIGPTTTPDARRRVVDRLTAHQNEFGFKRKQKISDEWTRLYRDDFFTWSDDEDPDVDAVVRQAKEALGRAFTKFGPMREALRPILDQEKTPGDRQGR